MQSTSRWKHEHCYGARGDSLEYQYAILIFDFAEGSFSSPNYRKNTQEHPLLGRKLPVRISRTQERDKFNENGRWWLSKHLVDDFPDDVSIEAGPLGVRGGAARRLRSPDVNKTSMEIWLRKRVLFARYTVMVAGGAVSM